MKITFLFLYLSLACFVHGEEPTHRSVSIKVSHVRQINEYYCGPAACQCVLKYWGSFAGDQDELAKILKTTASSGTHPRRIVQGLKTLDLQAVLKEHTTIDDLRAALKAGTTVIIDLQAWHEGERPDYETLWNDGHYIVVIDIDENYLYAMDPSLDDALGFIPLTELQQRWHDFEDEGTSIWKHFQLAIFVRGKNPRPNPDALLLPLKRIL